MKIRSWMSLVWAAGLLLSFSSCSKKVLTAYTEYLSHENLASYHVGSPDPNLNFPPIGQRLIVSWSLKSHLYQKYPLHIDIVIRFGDGQETRYNIPVDRCFGAWIFTLVNEEYFGFQGIATYKIDLIADETVVESWRHQIWTDLIVLTEPPDATERLAECLESNKDL